MDKSPKLSLKQILIIITVLAAVIISGYFVVNYETITDSEKSTLNGDLENHIKDIVQLTINQYDGSLDSITNLQFGEYYSFVLSGDLDKILVHPKKEMKKARDRG